jgi:tetratricopeptide (TPR) repeat protein
MHLEIDNIRAAWRYAVTQRQLPKIAQFIVGLPPFFEAQVWLQEGYAALKLASDHLRAALDDPNLNASDRHDIEAMLMMVLYCQSKFCSSLGSQAQAQALACESLTIAEKYDNWEQVASVRRILAKLAMYQGHSDEAKSQLKQALALYHQHNSYEHTLKILSMLAYIAADAGDYDEAEKWIEESLKRGRHLSQTNQHDRMKARDLLAGLPVETGLETSMLITPEAAKLPAELPLCTLGYVYFLMGKYQEARPILEEGLAEARAIGDQMYLTIALINMGYNSEALDEDEAAEMYFSEALVIARQAQSVPFALDILAGIGIRLVKGQEQARGLTILGLVFDHPASFQESKNRAAERLARLSLPLPAQQPGLWPADQSQILWQLVADWLAERQPVVSEV